MATTLQDFSDQMLFQSINTEESLPAFNELFERYWEKLYVIARARLPEEEEAQDCVQEVFVSIWTKRKDLPVPLSVPGYLIIAVRNRVLNQLHARQVREQHQHHYWKTAFDELPVASDDLETEELAVIIREEINQMPEQMRKIYLLSREDDLSGFEIAARLSLSHQTVRNQISSALKRIRDRIQRYQLQ